MKTNEIYKQINVLINEIEEKQRFLEDRIENLNYSVCGTLNAISKRLKKITSTISEDREILIEDEL